MSSRERHISTESEWLVSSGKAGGSILFKHLHANSFVPAAGCFDHLLYSKKSDCAYPPKKIKRMMLGTGGWGGDMVSKMSVGQIEELEFRSPAPT